MDLKDKEVFVHSVYSCACIVASCALIIWASFISKLFAKLL